MILYIKYLRRMFLCLSFSSNIVITWVSKLINVASTWVAEMRDSVIEVLRKYLFIKKNQYFPRVSLKVPSTEDLY